MPISIIEHKGKQIIYVDYKETTSPEEMIKLFHESAAFYQTMQGQQLFLTDFAGVKADGDFMKEVKKLGKEVFTRTEKAATIGLTGIQQILLNGYNRFTGKNVRAFGSKLEALDYLVT